MKGERTVEKRRERNTKKTLLDIYSKYGIILILILIMAFLTIRTGGTFIGKNNLLNILKQIACIGVLACGQTAVIIAGGMDLSVGSIVSLVSVLVASTAHPGDFPLIVPIMVGLLTGLVCGLINGLAVAKLCTAVIYLSMFVLMLWRAAPDWFLYADAALCACLILLAFVKYAIRYGGILREARADGARKQA